MGGGVKILELDLKILFQDLCSTGKNNLPFAGTITCVLPFRKLMFIHWASRPRLVGLLRRNTLNKKSLKLKLKATFEFSLIKLV